MVDSWYYGDQQLKTRYRGCLLKKDTELIHLGIIIHSSGFCFNVIATLITGFVFVGEDEGVHHHVISKSTSTRN